MKRHLVSLICSILTLSAHAQEDFQALIAERIITGLSRPVFLTHAPGDDSRLFIVEQTGDILIYDRSSKSILSEPFLSLSNLNTGSEEGLLGLAFHPDFTLNGHFYIYASRPSPRRTVVERYTTNLINPNEVDSGTLQSVINIRQPFSNHNAGWIDFGADGFLYIASGDGGSGNDPRNSGQSITDNPNTFDANEDLLGKILRIDVNADDFPADASLNYGIPGDNPLVDVTGADEIWAYGLRNPYRCSFDRQTNDLWIADVGQNNREEVNFQPASSSGGENYGWRLREGTIATPTGGVGGPLSGATEPVFDYAHNRSGGFSITGGYVYRGASMPWLHGKYFYADYVTNNIWTYDRGANQIVRRNDTIQSPSTPLDDISSFGEDSEGELYIVSLDGHVYRLTQSPYQLWRNQNFTPEELENGTLASGDQDPDNDGKPTLLEFVANQDPRTGDGPLPLTTSITQETATDRFFTLHFARAQPKSSVLLAGETNPTLQAGNWGDNITILMDTDSDFMFRSNIPINDAPTGFLRISVDTP